MKTVYCDVDETLVMSNLSDYDPALTINVPYKRGQNKVVPNQKNINLLIWFYKLGYDVHIWSKTGRPWAKAVGKALNLDFMKPKYLTKPDYYIDDLECQEWMGPRRYREMTNE